MPHPPAGVMPVAPQAIYGGHLFPHYPPADPMQYNVPGPAYPPSSRPVSTIAPSALYQYVQAPPGGHAQVAPARSPSDQSREPSVLRQATPPPPDFIEKNMQKAQAAAKDRSGSVNRTGRRGKGTDGVQEQEAQAGPSRPSPFAPPLEEAAPDGMQIDDDEPV